ncbi:hypothetical protein Cgig2_030565 [Carnegiea gigantea]|uniref:Uncharacterized protein n=1 Tax=Carnegiea gigantea TaxID=171969 RepID=A0A9Q1JG59_9CARY|nr:hypothetical protein Cgig2_030565 [Carnegiea gigantea]
MYLDYVLQYGVMAPCEKYLRDLTKKSRHFTIKVKIIEKTQPQVSSSKIMYQRIHMEDEKGGQMGVTIYGDDIASYVEAIKRRKEHEISDAVVKPLKRQSYENVDHLKSLREAVEEAKVSVKKAVLRSISDFKAMKLINEMFTSIVLNMNKMIFQFDLVDITGSWNATLFSDDASKVLGIKADKLYRMEYEVTSRLAYQI